MLAHQAKYQVNVIVNTITATYDSVRRTEVPSARKPLEYGSKAGISAIAYLLTGKRRNQRNDPGIKFISIWVKLHTICLLLIKL